jgi:hypothetical protein
MLGCLPTMPIPHPMILATLGCTKKMSPDKRVVVIGRVIRVKLELRDK